LWYLAQGQLEDAERVMRQAIQLNKRVDEGQFWLGEILRQRGDLVEACQAYYEAVELRQPGAEEARGEFCLQR
ncbi:MAG TPA: hypothetical protein DCR93_06525, partial [Cytophagales bacterium]|nr:hypothetical protein [Cytophagales bacterium]